jgi:extracellular elastinolytic metalloproteinase
LNSGNNVLTYKTTTTNTSPETGTDLVFSYIQDPTVAPTTTVNVNAARVNNFYLVRVVVMQHKSSKPWN